MLCQELERNKSLTEIHLDSERAAGGAASPWRGWGS